MQGSEAESPRVEIKNVAGAKNVERAVEFEYLRHIDLLKKGKVPLPETRRYEADYDRTVTLRIKDEAPDYRFYQDPDLPTIRVSDERVSRIRANMGGEVPFDTKKRFCTEFGMAVKDVKNVFKYPWSVEIFTQIVKNLEIDPRIVYQW